MLLGNWEDIVTIIMISMNHICKTGGYAKPPTAQDMLIVTAMNAHLFVVGVFIARGKEDALVTKNLVPGESVYGEKRISVEVSRRKNN